MTRSYYYFIATLPMLEFGAKAAFSYEDFLARAKEQLSDFDMDIIKRAKLGPFEDAKDSLAALREWKDFEITLRNELARHRAAKLTKDFSKFARGEHYIEPFISGFAHWAVNQESPLEAELYLDRTRWDKLEDLARGHYFDIDYLIMYALKLQILKRWKTINSEGGMQILEDLIGR